MAKPKGEKKASLEITGAFVGNLEFAPFEVRSCSNSQRGEIEKKERHGDKEAIPGKRLRGYQTWSSAMVRRLSLRLLL